MSMSSRGWRAAAGAVAAMAGAAIAAPRLAAVPAAGKPAPAFKAQTVEGKPISLAAYKGKSAVVLNFYSNT